MNREEKIEEIDKLLEIQEQCHKVFNFPYTRDIGIEALELYKELLQIKPRTTETLKHLRQFTNDEDVFYQAICEKDSIEAIREVLKVLVSGD